MKNKLILIFCTLTTVVCLERGYHKLTDGFSIKSISSNFETQEKWQTNLGNYEHLKDSLSKSYRYLAKGSQSYAFVSEDNKYVLKFFRHSRWRLSPFSKQLSKLPLFEKKLITWEKKKNEVLQDTFESCLVSFNTFFEETAMIALHLSPTDHLPHKLILCDKLGRNHTIDPNHFTFAVQKKAEMTSAVLERFRKNNQLEEAKNAISALIDFSMQRFKKGYLDKDPHLVRNFGFLDGKAIEIDIGGFYQDPKKDAYYFHHNEIEKIKAKLLPYLKKNYPELSYFALKKLNEITNTFDKQSE